MAEELGFLSEDRWHRLGTMRAIMVANPGVEMDKERWRAGGGGGLMSRPNGAENPEKTGVFSGKLIYTDVGMNASLGPCFVRGRNCPKTSSKLLP